MMKTNSAIAAAFVPALRPPSIVRRAQSIGYTAREAHGGERYATRTCSADHGVTGEYTAGGQTGTARPCGAGSSAAGQGDCGSRA